MRSSLQRYVTRLAILLPIGALLLFSVALLPFYPASSVGAQTGSGAYGAQDRYKELDDKVKLFFEEIISNSNATKAFEDFLRAGSGSSVSNNQSITEMKSKLDEIRNQFGDFKDFEKIDTKPFGKDLVIFRYLLKSDNHPVVWTLTFYRRPSSLTGSTSSVSSPWNVVGLRFDTNLDLLAL